MRRDSCRKAVGAKMLETDDTIQGILFKVKSELSLLEARTIGLETICLDLVDHDPSETENPSTSKNQNNSKGSLRSFGQLSRIALGGILYSV